MIKIQVKKGQVWKSKRSNLSVEICGVSGGKFKAKVLTNKPGVYNGSHTLARRTLQKDFVQILWE